MPAVINAKLYAIVPEHSSDGDMDVRVRIYVCVYDSMYSRTRMYMYTLNTQKLHTMGVFLTARSIPIKAVES